MDLKLIKNSYYYSNRLGNLLFWIIIHTGQKRVENSMGAIKSTIKETKPPDAVPVECRRREYYF